MTSRNGRAPFIRAILMTATVCCAIASTALSVAAQQTTAGSRGFVAFNVGLQASTEDFSDNLAFSLFVEEGSHEATYKGATALVFDVSGGGRVWRHLAIGGGLSVFSRETEASVSARLPHPFFFDQHRNVAGTAAGLTQSTVAVHVQALWMVPVSDSLDISIFGGPTFFTVSQDFVEMIKFTEEYPFDTAQFTGVSTTEASESTIGFNVGVDVAFYFSEHVGIGGLARFSRGSVDFSLAAGEVLSANVGGPEAMGGLRVRF